MNYVFIVSNTLYFLYYLSHGTKLYNFSIYAYGLAIALSDHISSLKSKYSKHNFKQLILVVNFDDNRIQRNRKSFLLELYSLLDFLHKQNSTLQFFTLSIAV